MTQCLPKWEILLYFILWSGGVVYSIYHVYLIGQVYYDFRNVGEEFSAGWLWLGGPSARQDISDFELNSWINFLCILSPWVITHLIVSLVTQTVLKEAVYVWYAVVSYLFLTYYLGVYATILISIQPLLFIWLMMFKKKVVIWSASLMFLITMMYFNIFVTNSFDLDFDRVYMLEMGMYWTHLRCLSFSLDSVKEGQSHYTFEVYIAYSLYLPTLFLGPHITFHHFIKESCAPSSTLFTKICNLLLELSRYLLCLFVIKFALHFIYVNALQLQIHFVESLSGWTMNGLAYCMGQYFHLKYVVVYGISTAVARCEGIEAPGIPKCIARIHRYSDMWRFFDRGLYQFLTRYLYHPMCKPGSSVLVKLLGSLLCFSFVWLWHGPSHLFVGVWSFLNFIGVSIEALCKELNESSFVQTIKSHIRKPNVERLEGILATPLTIMSIISNIYFFGGMDVGNAYVRYMFQGGWMYTVLFIYSLRHVSVSVAHWEKEKSHSRKYGVKVKV